MDHVLREIGMIARALDSISNVEFQQYDLTKGQYLYLVRICEHPGIIQEQLSRLVMVDRTTVIRAVQRLVDHQFVEKRPDTENKKIRRLYPTEKARLIYQRIVAEEAYSDRTALTGMTPAEIQQLNTLLYKARLNVTADWDRVKRGAQRDY
ncbi:MAG TPA: MarR family transcriptional regulator [Candidatus Levilactobacillus faecigallinarum]|uniref:MarR family transcriptional regulator n=1 Tax=Candidatus Levilactobacillus faecigallinarum TaxID=2838638 RepID=A0A9D1QT68_9LACO|nr:MarR family transcriptional regulator [Candidatus Levilactobacillus faecigallinarum]